MLDRLISGAGALTDRADRLVRALTSGRGPDVMGNRPGSVLVIVILIVGSVVFGLLALESTDNPTPRAIAPAEVASADDIGRRVYATIEGVVANETYVETFPDDDGDGIQDADETGDAWYYFLVDESGSGVTVRSTRHPDDIYRYTATGVVVRDPEYVSVDVAQFGQLEGSSGIELDDTFYLDASSAPPGSPQPLDLSAEMPAPGTAVTITGPDIGWLDVCSGDADGDGECEESEFDAIDAFIADPGSGRAITVLQADDQPAPVPVQFTGMLRDEAASIRDAKSTRDLDFDSLGITVSDRYLLDDQATPASAGLSLGLAILAGLLAAILAIGLVGGYLVVPTVEATASIGRPDHGTGRRDRGPRDRSAAPGGRPDPRPRGEGPAAAVPARVADRTASRRRTRRARRTRGDSRGNPSPRTGGIDARTRSCAGRTRGPGPMGGAGDSGDPELVLGRGRHAGRRSRLGRACSPIGRADHPDRRAVRQARGRRAREGRAQATGVRARDAVPRSAPGPPGAGRDRHAATLVRLEGGA